MKNIFLLPTDQPSRLFKFANKLHLDTISKDYYKKYNINITSDEEIKQGDWCLNANKDTIYKKDKYPMDISWDKIILTTDPTLIADGVQAIDDEFLEWFVKNPTCDFVEVDRDEREVGNHLGGIATEYGDYKLIIPQEETKQESLEEAAEKYLQEWRLVNNIHLSNVIHAERCKNDFIAGANYQAERMYSEEELKSAFRTGFGIGYGSDIYAIDVKDKICDEWFKQIKKK